MTRADGSQGVEMIKRDLGLRADDKEGMVARLRAQGVAAQSVELYGGVEMDDKDGAKRPKPPTLGRTAATSPQRLSKRHGGKGTLYTVPGTRTGDVSTQVSMNAPTSGDQAAAPPRAPAPKVNPYDNLIQRMKELMKREVLED